VVKLRPRESVVGNTFNPLQKVAPGGSEVVQVVGRVVTGMMAVENVVEGGSVGLWKISDTLLVSVLVLVLKEKMVVTVIVPWARQTFIVMRTYNRNQRISMLPSRNFRLGRSSCFGG
jgi:hypothetical protein